MNISLQNLLGCLGHLVENLDRGFIRADRHGLLVDDAPGVGLLDHLVQGRAGLGLALQDRPVERRAAAELRQQRAVHVERTESRPLQDGHRQHAAVVEGEDQIRVPDLPFNFIESRLGQDCKTAVTGKIEKTCVPARFVRVVLVRDDERHLDAGVEEDGETANSYVPVAEDDRLASQGCSFSSTACTSQRGRSRTCW